MFIFYLFSVSTIMFLALYLGAGLGFTELSEALFAPSGYGNTLLGAASTLSYAFVASAIWFFHWKNLNLLRLKPNTDAGGLVTIYLLGAVLTLALGFYASAGGTLSSFFRVVDGGDGYQLAEFLSSGLRMLLTSALWVYHLLIFSTIYKSGSVAKTRKSKA